MSQQGEQRSINVAVRMRCLNQKEVYILLNYST